MMAAMNGRFPSDLLAASAAALALAAGGAALASATTVGGDAPIVVIQGNNSPSTPDATVMLAGVVTGLSPNFGTPHYFIQVRSIKCTGHATSVSFMARHVRRVLPCSTRLAMLTGYLSAGSIVGIKVRAVRATRSGHILKRGPLRSATIRLPKPDNEPGNIPTVTSTTPAPAN
jgi:hypothetical protein